MIPEEGYWLELRLLRSAFLRVSLFDGFFYLLQFETGFLKFFVR